MPLIVAMLLVLACAAPVVAAPAASAQSPSACSDGVDNDGDGRIDFPADSGCGSENSDSEADEPDRGPGVSACSDGADNDGDGRVDFPADPECGSPNSDSETDDPAPQAPSPAPAPGSAPAPGGTQQPPGASGGSRSSGIAGMALARRGCVRRVVEAIVIGNALARLSVAIDGRRVSVVPAAGRERVRVRAGARRLRPGRHRLTVAVTFRDGTRKVLRVAFARCR